MTRTAPVIPSRPNIVTHRAFAPAIVTLAILLGMPALGGPPAYAKPKLTISGCSDEVSNGSAAKACIDKGVSDGVTRTIMCTVSGNYCCKQSSSGYISGCTSLRESFAAPGTVLPTQAQLPPRTLVTPIIGGATPPTSGLKVVGAP
jgi:hypothetical protein